MVLELPATKGKGFTPNKATAFTPEHDFPSKVLTHALHISQHNVVVQRKGVGITCKELPIKEANRFHVLTTQRESPDYLKISAQDKKQSVRRSPVSIAHNHEFSPVLGEHPAVIKFPSIVQVVETASR